MQTVLGEESKSDRRDQACSRSLPSILPPSAATALGPHTTALKQKRPCTSHVHRQQLLKVSGGVETHLRYPVRAAAAEAVGGEGEERFVEAAGLHEHRNGQEGRREGQQVQRTQLTIEGRRYFH